MPIASDHPLALAYWLREPQHRAAALAALPVELTLVEIEALVELLHADDSALGVQAIGRLAACEAPLVIDGLLAAAESQHPSVRLAALAPLAMRQQVAAVALRLRSDPSWTVRREAVRALITIGALPQWLAPALVAASDPHWRVRNALIEALDAGARDDVERALADASLAAQPASATIDGVRAYLAYRWHGEAALAAWPRVAAASPETWCSFWDWDPAVLARRLHALGRNGRRANLSIMPRLAMHDEHAVREPALDALRRDGNVPLWTQLLEVIDEPRRPAHAAIHQFFARLSLDLCRDVASAVLADENASSARRAWAQAQLDESHIEQVTSPVKLLSRDHPHQRATSLTPDRAAALVAEPTLETSWHVLAAAARLAKTPLWKLSPARPPLALAVRDEPEPLSLSPLAPRDPRRVGPAGLEVSRVGISGHYHLPVAGFQQAVEAGVNSLFWEPNYHTLTSFAARIAARDRRKLHFLAGTFEAEPRRIRRDVERTLRQLRLERLDIFLLFWVQSWQRIDDAVRRELDDLQATGLISMFGLSTHNRPLAIEAIERGWNPIMVRHSAAHRRAEEAILPLAARQGVSVFTFNNTCYGRLLCARGRRTAVTASDCYRYSLAQPGVTACWSAPANLEQLADGLAVLAHPSLDETRRTQLIAHGEEVYREDAILAQLVRSR